MRKPVQLQTGKSVHVCDELKRRGHACTGFTDHEGSAVLAERPGRGAASHVIHVMGLRSVEHSREMIEYAAGELRGATGGGGAR